MSPQGESEAVSHDEPAEFLLRGMPEDKPFDLEERHFALMKSVPYQPRLARNHFLVRNSRSDPCVSSVHNFDHNCYFGLLSAEEHSRTGCPNSIKHDADPSRPDLHTSLRVAKLSREI